MQSLLLRGKQLGQQRLMFLNREKKLPRSNDIKINLYSVYCRNTVLSVYNEKQY